jgi:hypothetical protein
MLRRARQVPRFARRRSVTALNRAASRIELRKGVAAEVPLAHPPIFIVGAPRSGSTLLYQLLVVRFDVGYLSNLHCRLYGAPALVERMAGRRLEPPAAFSSDHGRTDGLAAPSECGPYWYRFFRKSPQHVSLEDAEPESLQDLRASVRALGDAAGRPLVFKNLLNSLRLEPLGAAFPEAIFLVVERDLADNVASILAARRSLCGDESAWWSAEPPDVDLLRGQPPEAQAAGQVRGIHALIDSARQRLGADRFLDIAYEQLCADTHAVLAEISGFASSHGLELALRGSVPPRFESGRGSRLQQA